MNNDLKLKNNTETATFGAGCFWCIEAIYQLLKGVVKVIPGYAGGLVKNPTYYEICQGNTGHAEVCQIIYDPEVISYDELLEVFWLIHDPTSQNYQDYDIGPQYRSTIFYHNKEQETSSEEYRLMLESSGEYNNPIVTEIKPFTEFYQAEICNMNYYYLNANTPYSMYVITPKVTKFKKVFRDKLKTAKAFN
jgi:peptide-methionine (S)-S-oxide reductase